MQTLASLSSRADLAATAQFDPESCWELPDLSQLSWEDQHKAMHGFLRMTQNPATFEAIYDLDEVLRTTQLSEISMHHLRAQPEMLALMAERYLAPVPNLEELLTYPSESLGYQFAAHMVAHQFEPEFYRKRVVMDDISYVSLRRSQTHDIYHVVTGFGTDPSGELGLQAFQLAQMRSPIAIAIMGASLINVLGQTDHLMSYMNQISLGWQMGLHAKPLLAQKWEENWEKPLVQWRQELGLDRVEIWP